MSRSFLVKDIALQANVSPATVDRVLNRRPGVREHTVRRVEQALRDMEKQREQVGLKGKKFMVDVVMETPTRFSQVVRASLDAVMPFMHPVIFRARYHFDEVMPLEKMVATLDAIAARGSHCVFLKAPDVPEVVLAVARLHARGIPVITVATDLPTALRQAYVGIDNRAAGQTAAYLLGQWLGKSAAGVLVSLSSNRFRGEEEREIGFRQAIRMNYPKLTLHDVSGGHGVHQATAELASQCLAANPGIAAVYSIGGANAAIVQAFERAKRTCRVFIGHDLDDDNIRLLRAGKLNAVLHHDVQHDMRTACLQVMRIHGEKLSAGYFAPSNVQVVTQYNLPWDLH
jgi:LacI family transcriptional regulator